MKEREVKGYFLSEVGRMGGLTRKVSWENRTGAPDWVLMYRGKTVWVELKATGESPAPHQVREMGRMKDAGQWVVVVDSKETIDILIAEITT